MAIKTESPLKKFSFYLLEGVRFLREDLSYLFSADPQRPVVVTKQTKLDREQLFQKIASLQRELELQKRRDTHFEQQLRILKRAVKNSQGQQQGLSDELESLAKVLRQ
ncbi:MAG: hypothetical protein HON68_07530 [Gammaproteobacteria bacterium]|jgi:vacuolar-type H+-ATPase subunit I/STV1|nr:hypothetical protein [Gammaproteobacteria bacterium]MBT3490566.1 hypothetical protein [Gammaproteobacteria bacterium]MBT3718356.1 hypothetical protein [Gammaproteobacteria bacterium]MBT3845164.1 hypothetical protein [Gammaproteobacteria bacterium]MBT3892673.1 hypothetical protein [Gammaproteobacteria bacterium]